MLRTVPDARATGTGNLFDIGRPYTARVDQQEGLAVDATDGSMTTIGWLADPARDIWATLTLPTEFAAELLRDLHRT